MLIVITTEFNFLVLDLLFIHLNFIDKCYQILKIKQKIIIEENITSFI